MNRRWIFWGAVVLLAALTAAAYRTRPPADPPPVAAPLAPAASQPAASIKPAEVTRPVPPTPAVPTATVRRGTMTAYVYASGIVRANCVENIKCQAGGQIIDLPYRVGDSVKKGAVVLQLDSQSQQAAVQIARQSLRQQELNYQNAALNLRIAQQNLDNSRQNDQAAVLSDQAQVVNDRINLQRDRTLLAENLTSQEQYDNDHTTLTRDEQTLRQAQVNLAGLKTQELQVQIEQNNTQIYKALIQSDQASLAQAKLNLAYTTVRAPISGVISAIDVQPGQVIASALTNVGGGTTVMSIVDLSRLFVLANIKQRDINYVRVGDTVRVTSVGAPGEVFPGRVVRLAPVATPHWDVYSGSVWSAPTGGQANFQVKIEVLGPHKQDLKPGMTARVDILTNRLANILYLPRQAVRHRNGRTTVLVVQPDHRVISRPITLGQRNKTFCQIISGLQEGCQVLVQRSRDARALPIGSGGGP